MPRVQDGPFGASERFAVSPGRERDGYLQLPGGPSGHPLSPFYRSGFEDWAKGVPTPFLPGPTAHKLVLRPGGAATNRSTHERSAFLGHGKLRRDARSHDGGECRGNTRHGRCSSRASPARARRSSPRKSPGALQRPLYEWHIKSTSKAQQGLYEYDAVSRLRDSQLGDEKVRDIRNYIGRAACGRRSSRRCSRCCSSTRSTRPTSNSPTTCCASSIAWSSSSTRRASW